LPDIHKPGRAVLTSLLFCALIVLAWTGLIDRHAAQANQSNLERSLLAYAAARTLNAVISVAQGTEIAVQPIGVGVTITVGEVLDPLNDLIERFSWVVLLAAASLGAQALVIDMSGTIAFNIITSLAALTLIARLWVPRGTLWPGVERIAILVLFLRFAVAGVTIVGGWIDSHYLAARQQQALESLEQVGRNVETLQPDQAADSAPSVLDRLKGLADTADIQSRLLEMQARVEAGISELITLASAFVLQTLLLPLAFLWLAYAQIKRFTH
jgi:hypothetical protein